MDTNNHFSLQKSTKLFTTPTKFFWGGQKLPFFEKWPQLTLLDEFDVEKKLKFPEHAEYSLITANFWSLSTSAQYVRIVANMSTFATSAQYV